VELCICELEQEEGLEAEILTSSYYGLFLGVPSEMTGGGGGGMVKISWWWWWGYVFTNTKQGRGLGPENPK